MLIIGKRWCLAALASAFGFLSGCIELEQRVRVHDDGSASIRATIKIDPQYEAMVLPAMKEEMPKQAPPGVRLDFTQRIDGKAAVVIEAEGAAAAEMLKEGATTITITGGGFMKKRYEYRETVQRVPDVPVPSRAVITLPGSIESVVGGKKTADDTVEFDQTHAKRGDVYAVTSTAFAFGFGGGSSAVGVPVPGATNWLLPVSIGSICAGALLLLTGWIRSGQGTRAGGASAVALASPPPTQASARAEPVASVFCIECGAANAAPRKFCGQCGHALEKS